MTRLRDSSGFTLVEVMVAALILVVGAGAAFSLIDSANRNVSFNNARVASTNLGRELAEYARTTDYDLLQPTQLVSALRKHSSIKGTLSGGAWTIERRGVTYTISASVCTFDDPKDGLAATAPTNACPKPAAVAGAPTEINPDDFRRVTYTMTWTARGRTASMTHATLVVNPAGGLGPSLKEFTEPAAQITEDSVSWGGPWLLKLTSNTATSVHWFADDGVSGGDASGGPTEWGFDWKLGDEFSSPSPWVRDGSYTLQAQAFDSRGVPGEAKIVTVHVNRHEPAQVSGLAAGYNKRLGVVDMRWARYEERDLQGYRVERADGVQICPAGSGLQQTVSCTDTNPPLLGSAYKVYAVDCEDLKAQECKPRNGIASPTLTIPLVAGTAPDPPTGLTAIVDDGKPTLSWTAPASVPNGPIRFYRIYRDSGTGLADRYDETVTSDPSYVDPHPGATTAHKYWVTAVDQYFNESDPSTPTMPT